MPERQVVAKLLADADVVALVVARVRPVMLHKDDTYPAIVYDIVDDAPRNSSAGQTPSRTMHLELGCLGTTWAQARAVSVAAEDAIAGATAISAFRAVGTYPKVSMVHTQSIQRIHGPLAEGGEGLLYYGFLQTYLIEYRTGA